MRGGILTDFGEGCLHDPAWQKAVVADTPLARLGQPDDITDAIAALLSPDPREITGQRVEATGGYEL